MKPTIVFIHGLSASPRIYEGLVPYFANYPVKYIELAGHDYHTWDFPNTNYQDIQKKIIEDIEKIKGPKIIIGQSFVYTLLINHQHLYDKAVFLGAPIVVKAARTKYYLTKIIKKLSPKYKYVKRNDPYLVSKVTAPHIPIHVIDIFFSAVQAIEQPHYTKPMLFLFSDEDTLVNIKQSVRKVIKHGGETKIYHDQRHALIPGPDDHKIAQDILQWIER